MKEGLRRVVMAGTHGIEAGILHQADLSHLSTVECRRSKNSVIMMDTSSIEFYVLSVQDQAVLSRI